MSADAAVESRLVLAAEAGEAAPPRGAAVPAQASLWVALAAVRALGLHSVLLHRADHWGRPPPLDWHPRRSRFAVVDSKGLVAIHTCDAGQLRLEGPPERLAHAGIRDIAAVRWRPNAKNALAVAHGSGICLWTNDSGPAPALASGIRGLAAPSSWRRTALRPGGSRKPVVALCWSPCGQFLAAGSPEDSAFAVWEIATRVCTRLRSGSLGARVLRWSPKGSYLVVAGFDASSFEIWETHTWTCQRWSTGEHALTDAAWSADEKLVFLALSGSLQIAALHFVGSAPSLLAHLLPLELPGLVSEPPGLRITSLAFDSAAGKMAVACTAAETDNAAATHLACVYQVQCSPVVVAKPLGRVAAPPADRTAAMRGVAGVAFRAGAPASTAARAQPASTLALSWPDGSVSLAAV